MKTVKYMSTPYRAVKGVIKRVSGQGMYMSIASCFHIHFLDDNEKIKESFTAEAHAEFIVRACNSHEELLEACKLTIKPLLALAKFIDTEGQKIPFEVRDASQAVLKAIAKAEGK